MLDNLLASEVRYAYFFQKLESPAWLEPLKNAGWFDPESNVSVSASEVLVKELDWFDWWRPLMDTNWFDPQSNSLTKTRERSSKTDTVAPWHALEYVERIAEHTKDHPCDETISTLVEILDTIVDCPEDTAKKIRGDWTLSKRISTIISGLPMDKRKNKHVAFENLALESLKSVMAPIRDTYRLIVSIEHNTTSAFGEWLSNMSRAERIDFLREAHKFVDKIEYLTEQGLANIYREYVVLILQRLMSYLNVCHNVFSPDQCSTFSGLLPALQDRKNFDWEAFLKFIHELFSLEHFWTNDGINDFKYKNQILADIAELIAVGMANDAYDFDPQLLPLVEQILLLLVEKTESKCALEETPMGTFLNSSKGMAFWAMISYTLRFACTNSNQQRDFRWPQAIRDDFTKRLDKSIESSFEFSFALGYFLPLLLYLDRKWVVDNINYIFPLQDEHHWYATFSAHLLSSDKNHESLDFLLKEDGHYQKALSTNFAHHTIETALAMHICTFWLENEEDLNDKTGLIYQALNSNNLNFLSAVLSFFSDRINNLTEEDKAEIRSRLWSLFEVLSESKNEKVCREIFGKLSKWIVFIDRIDQEALKWLKLAVRYITWDIGDLVKTLLTHAVRTPAEVAIIYLQLSKRGISSLLASRFEPDEVIKTIRILYDAGHKEDADKICIQFAENGYDFLKPLYEEYQH